MVQFKWFSGGTIWSAAMVMVVACGQASPDPADSSSESVQQPVRHTAAAGKKRKQRQHARLPKHRLHGRHRGGHQAPASGGNGASTGGNASATGGSTGSGAAATGGMSDGGRMGRGGDGPASGGTSNAGGMAPGGSTGMGTGGVWYDPSVCGDGLPEGWESCDDGNTEPGDGCGADCQVELGWSCPQFGMPCHEVVCGDGQADWYEVEMDGGHVDYAYEECDDGNTADGDGCTSQCTAEAGYSCETAGEPCRRVVCGDGLQDTYVADVGGSNGTVWDYELCDDGNNDNSDGCSEDCIPEPNFICNSPGEPCKPVVCGDGSQDTYVTEVVVNGPSGAAGAPSGTGGAFGTGGVWIGTGGSAGTIADGVEVRYGWEQCDDGNATDADGCSATCELEPGYVCSQPGQPCYQPACGDGFQDAYFVPGSAGAAGAPGAATGGFYGGRGGATSYGGRGAIVPGTGGSGMADGTWIWESCDDGNTADGDGCSATCQTESGYVCSEPGQPCHVPVCGDGFQDQYFVPGSGGAAGAPGVGTGGTSSYGGGGAVGTGGSYSGGYVWEACDDGNTDLGDGCSATCELESGWVCPSPGQPCVVSVCGDGIEDYNTEECDDGNNTDGDGCSAACTYEYEY